MNRNFRHFRKLLKEVFDWSESVVIAIVAIIVVFTFFMRVTSVDGTSMLPTLEDGERLIITDFLIKPTYNDIVVIQAKGLERESHDSGGFFESGNAPAEMGKPIIKRVVGLPGDKIDIDFEAGIVSRNGVPMNLSEKDGRLYEDGHMVNTPTSLMEGQVFPVTVPEGTIFVMGDNRNASMDSRDPKVGFVDYKYIIGKAFFRITPSSKFGSL
ncbi:signal peptidase I [Clostridia bacterium]|nr:signal peptidase I [Clostridia bacterium]